MSNNNSSLTINLVFISINMLNSSSKVRTSNGIVGLPCNGSQVPGCQVRGQSCYVEVTLGLPTTGNDKMLSRNLNLKNNFPDNHNTESSAMTSGGQKGSPDQSSVYERTFIYPVEAVLVPVLQTSFARSSLKRYINYCVPIVAYSLIEQTSKSGGPGGNNPIVLTI